MSESSIQSAEKPPIEFVDENGEELFPTVDVALAMELPGLVAPELEDPAQTAENFHENLTRLAGGLQRSFGRAEDLRGRGRSWFKMLQAIRVDVTVGLDRSGGSFPRPYKSLRRAVYELAPAEMDYFLDLVNENRDASEADLVAAGEVEGPSRMAKVLGNAPRLHENTPENLDALKQVVAAHDTLSFLEGYSRAASTLELGLVMGDKKHTLTAIQLFNRLRNIACSEMDIDDKIIAQMEAGTGIIQLVESLVIAQPDPELRAHMADRLQDFQAIVLQHRLNQRAMSLLVYGREYRLNGNHHLESKPAADPASEQEDAVAAEPVQARPEPEQQSTQEPEINLLELYRTAIGNLLRDGNYRHFEPLTTKEMKKRELDDARAVLVKGETDLDNNVVVAGRSKAEAQRFVSRVEFLRSFIADAGGDVATAQEMLEEAMAASSEHDNELKKLLSEADGIFSTKESMDLKAQVPDTETVADVVAGIREDWDTASFVIGNYWPGRRAAAEKLRQLLFMDRQEVIQKIIQETEVSKVQQSRR
ncbi:MAG TPA: hypothetical protein VN554_03480 [Verrucomicrobiae bacterium]|nr:hypothetical protein [Verrucomicrobiae bacterium]